MDNLLSTADDNSTPGFISFANISRLTVFGGSSKYALITLQHGALASAKGIKAVTYKSNIKYYGASSLLTNYSTNRLNGIYKMAPGQIILSLNNTNNAAGHIFTAAAEANKEIIAFSISNNKGEAFNVNNIKISLNYLGGVNPTNFYLTRLYKDLGCNRELHSSR